MIISLSLLRVSLLWTNCDYFSWTAFGAKGQTQKINTDPQELFLASCCSLRMSGLAECCMLWWDWGSPIAQGPQVRRALDSLRCVKVCLGRIGFCASTHASLCVCAMVCTSTHVGWMCTFCSYRSVFFFLIFLPARHSVTSSKDIALCTSFYGCWRTWKAHISVADECRCDEKRTSRLKGMSEKVFCMGVLAWDSVCIRGGVFPGRCMCVPNSCVRVSLCVRLRRWICKCVCLGEWSAWLSPR